MTVQMELAHPLDAIPEPSPLAAARQRRHLSVEQVSHRTGLSADEIAWLEEGRLYRFPSQNGAMLAAVVYATALGVDRLEARRMAGLPIAPGLRVNARVRLVVVAALAAALSALGVLIFAPGLELRTTRTKTVAERPNANLPPPWKLDVSVLNGSGDITWTRTVASRIGAMGYAIQHVGKADRFDYPASTVLFGPGGRAVGLRLAHQLDVSARSMPGLAPNQLLVIVGPQRALD